MVNTAPGFPCDVLTAGNGATGLFLALHLAEHSSVTVLSRGPVSEGSTFCAQGRIAAIFGEMDSIESHVKDTLVVGAGLCDRRAVTFVASNARLCVQWLIDQGVLFDTQVQANGEESYHLIREEGHSHRRTLHAAGATGKTVETTLVNKALTHPNIRIIERSNAVDLIVSGKADLPGTRWMVGAWIWNRNKERVETCGAKAVVLATSGAAKAYQYITNPGVFSGDGIAMAWQASYRVVNLKLNQFRSTALYHPQARNFPLIEALCDEGTHLRRPGSTHFMPDFDGHGELAPRNIVTRAIDHEMKRLGVDCTFLDINHKSKAFIRQHFPMIYEELLGLGVGLTKDPVPVAPAARHTCGGVIVGDNGRTDVDSLYATGEVSYTGLHGVNRMASDSLLGCLVYGWPAAEGIARRLPLAQKVTTLPAWDESQVEIPDELMVIQYNWYELCLLMWDYVGIVRTTRRLERALRHITMLQQELDEYYARFRVSSDLLEPRNLVQVAELIIRCTMLRKENRGLHYTLGYPQPLLNSDLSMLPSLARIKG